MREDENERCIYVYLTFDHKDIEGLGGMIVGYLVTKTTYKNTENICGKDTISFILFNPLNIVRTETVRSISFFQMTLNASVCVCNAKAASRN